MSVHKRGNKWGTKIYDRVAGKYIWLGTYERKSDAKAVEHDAIQRMKVGDAAKPKQMTFGQFSQQWFETLNVRRSTREDYENTLRHLNARFGNTTLSRITAEDIEQFLAKFSESHADLTTRKAFVRMKQILRRAVQRGYILRSPADLVQNVPAAKRRRRIRVLCSEEIAKLLAALPEYWQPLAQTAVLTGLRRNELFGLRWEDVQLEGGVIEVRKQLQNRTLVDPKTENAQRRIPIGSTLKSVLAQHRERVSYSELDLVFPSETGNPVNTSWFDRSVWKRALRKADLKDVTLHTLRHTFASALIKQGKDVKYIQTVMGHASATTTLDTYGHLFPLHNDDTAELLEKQLFSA